MRAETERMPKLVVGYTELGCSKLKKGKGFFCPAALTLLKLC